MTENPKFDKLKKLSAHRVQGPTKPLTQRQREILILTGQGLNREEIGLGLGISEKTVKIHLANTRVRLLEKTTRGALIRALGTKEIKLKEVFP